MADHVWVQELPVACPRCPEATRSHRALTNVAWTWIRDGFLIGEAGREGHVYKCSWCGGTVVQLATREAPADVTFAAKYDVVGARAHVRLHRRSTSGGFATFLGVNVMEKHEAEAFLAMVKRDFDSKDKTIRACAWCGDNICSAEGVTGDKCPSCEADFKAGEPKPKGFDE